MLKWLPAPIVGCFNAAILVVNTIFWCIPMYSLYFFKILSKTLTWRRRVNSILIDVATHWIRCNNLLMNLMMDIEWDLPDLSSLRQDQWYFIISNHQSWTDILVLQKIFLNRIPFLRFFIKKELLWLPLLNLAWWAYDFPIMHRHSKEDLKKNPELREKDLLATQKACQIYQHFPVAILNFLEGTRFTTAKHLKQQSPFKHLLKPKVGGFAYAVNAMNKKITHVLDITIVYPEGRQSFWDFLCGRVHKIIVNIHELEIPDELLQGDYRDDQHYRENFSQWVNNLWLGKDNLLDVLLKSDSP